MLDVYLLEDPLPPGLLEPGLELGAQQVDLAMQDPPSVRDFELFLGELVDELLEVVVRE